MRSVRSTAALLAVALFAAPTAASAEDSGPIRRGVAGLAKNGGFVLGIDNAFGYVVKSSNGTSINHFGLGPGAPTTYLSFHGVVLGGVTLGGVLSPFVLRQDAGVSATGILIGPRVGYLLMSPRGVGVWPRVGMNVFLNMSRTGGAGHFYWLAVEAPVVVSITEHAGVTIGPMLERPLGTAQPSAAGITAGLMGAF
jgi:hypothetical protein